MAKRGAPVDGKTWRPRFGAACATSASDRGSAWACAAGKGPGAVKADEESNEITAVPLLDLRGLTDWSVPTDARRCQRAMGQKIVANGGAWGLARKGNQPNLSAAVAACRALGNHALARPGGNNRQPRFGRAGAGGNAPRFLPARRRRRGARGRRFADGDGPARVGKGRTRAKSRRQAPWRDALGYWPPVGFGARGQQKQPKALADRTQTALWVRWRHPRSRLPCPRGVCAAEFCDVAASRLAFA